MSAPAPRLNLSFNRKTQVSDWRAKLCQDLPVPIALRVSDGWRLITEALFRNLKRYDQEHMVKSVYDHHGGLRVEWHGYTKPEGLMLARIAWERSFRTCSRCGDEGRHHARMRRLETTCERCHEVLMKEDPDGRFQA
jgi:hypothetical protein